uniref:Reverse transcriptase domain-containing protein n=1 Tax=Anolis carolinensis TaxID=28377 RepID=A0A803TEG4_ANOCA
MDSDRAMLFILLYSELHPITQKKGPLVVAQCVKEESAKAGLQLNIKKTKIMATRLIDNWQIGGENVEAVTDFIFPGAKITADADCSQEVRRRLLLGRRAMANLDKIVKSRDITLTTKVHIVKAMVFPIVTYGCESRIIRKHERRKIDAFELWCWRKILRVPWTARRSNQSILQEIMPDCSLEGRILEAKLKYFGHIMRRQESLEKIMMLGKMEGKRKRGRPRARWMDGILEVTGLTLKELGAATADRELWCGLVHEVTSKEEELGYPAFPGLFEKSYFFNCTKCIRLWINYNSHHAKLTLRNSISTSSLLCWASLL